MSQARPQISIKNLIKIQSITGRSSYGFDVSLSEVLELYRKYEYFYKNYNGDKK